MELTNTLKDKVISVLKSNVATRNSDTLLYLQVCEGFNPLVSNMNFEYVFENRKSLGIPQYESVSRMRRKVQEEFKELQADKEVKAERDQLETEVRAWACK